MKLPIIIKALCVFDGRCWDFYYKQLHIFFYLLYKFTSIAKQRMLLSGQESRPKLKVELLKSFHKFISSYNIHPVSWFNLFN